MATTTRIHPGMAPPPRLEPTPEMVQLAHRVYEALQEAREWSIVIYIPQEKIMAEWFAEFAQNFKHAKIDNVSKIYYPIVLFSKASHETCSNFLRMSGYVDMGGFLRPLSERI